MNRSITMMALALTTILTGVVSAHEITITDRFQPQFTVWFPNNWTVTLKDDRATATTDDGLLWTGVWDLEDTPGLKAAQKRIKERAGEMFQNVSYDDPVLVDLEGMKGGTVEGRGTYKGKDIVFFVIAFEHADDRVGVVAFIGDPAVRTLYRTTIIDIADSIRANAEFYAKEAAAAR